MNCISKAGCPVVGCDANGECYLWRCANHGATATISRDEQPPTVHPSLPLALVLAAFLFNSNGDYEEDLERERRAAQQIETAAKSYASQIAACMNGGAIFWVDPHSSNTKAVFCDVQKISTKAF